MPLFRSSHAGWLLLAALGFGCTTPPAPPAALTTWALSDSPDLVIGPDGSSEGEFNRVVGAVPLPDDAVAVVDQGHGEIRIFGADGRYLRTFGRRGAGPGEFRAISWAALQRDTMVVYDVGQRRATLLGLDGAVLATVEPSAEGYVGTVTPSARLANGNWLVSAGAPAPRVSGPEGVLRDTLYFAVLPPGGAGALSLLHRSPTSAVVAISERSAFVPGYFFALAMAVPLGERVGIADPDAGTVTFYTMQGTEVGRMTLPMPRHPIERDELDRLRAAALEGVEGDVRRGVEARFLPEAAPAAVPAFRNVLTDGDDILWLEEWQHEPAPFSRYHVVGVDGQWLATVDMPPGFRALTIGPDWVLGIHRDEDGVQRVMRYGLERR